MSREEEIIKQALRARKFSMEESLKQGIDLINFALKLRKVRYERD